MIIINSDINSILFNELRLVRISYEYDIIYSISHVFNWYSLNINNKKQLKVAILSGDNEYDIYLFTTQILLNY